MLIDNYMNYFNFHSIRLFLFHRVWFAKYTFTIVAKLSIYVSEKSDCLPFTIPVLCLACLVVYSILALVFESYIDAANVILCFFIYDFVYFSG
jgi:hypothetical protein